MEKLKAISFDVENTLRGKNLGVIVDFETSGKQTTLSILRVAEGQLSTGTGYEIIQKTIPARVARRRGLECPGFIVVYGGRFDNVDLAFDKDFTRIGKEEGENLEDKYRDYLAKNPVDHKRIMQQGYAFIKASL